MKESQLVYKPVRSGLWYMLVVKKDLSWHIGQEGSFLLYN